MNNIFGQLDIKFKFFTAVKLGMGVCFGWSLARGILALIFQLITYLLN